MAGARIIAITGGSGSGKSEIAVRLRDLLAPRATALIAEDDYYFCASTIDRFDPATFNFDAPAAKDHALLAAHLKAARAGLAFDKPLYAHATHRRLPERETIPAVDALVLDGHLALCDPAIRVHVDLAVFIDAEEATRLARRLARDTALRARTPESVHQQFRSVVAPMHALYVEPQRALSQLVLRNAGDDPAALTALAQEIALRAYPSEPTGRA
ncbi:MAG: uridine kinase [Alphaproteobacteria bacterium]|nr:uridine kinase [Alphaproteobacteria bacterium]